MSDLPPMGEPLEHGEYVHSKSGRHYFLIFEGRDSETTEPVVCYQQMYGDGSIWFRPKSMWNELVEVEGEMVPRFSKLEDPPSTWWISRLLLKVFGYQEPESPSSGTLSEPASEAR